MIRLPPDKLDKLEVGLGQAHVAVSWERRAERHPNAGTKAYCRLEESGGVVRGRMRPIDDRKRRFLPTTDKNPSYCSSGRLVGMRVRQGPIQGHSKPGK